MSTQIRKKYELRARADGQRETRDRIARVASELHEEKGVAQTTVAEIARRAGVSRLTVYNHFPDLAALLPACSAHYEGRHPVPDFDLTSATDPVARVIGALTRLYGWYRETQSLFSKAFSDRASVPELDRFLREGVDRMQDELAAALGRALGDQDDPIEKQVLLRLAVDFWTWQRLTREGLDDATAAQLMARMATAVRPE